MQKDKNIFVSSVDGYKVDLDDLSIYPDEWKNKDLWLFFIDCCKQAAWSIFYMDYWNGEFGSEYYSQRIKVTNLISELMSFKSKISGSSMTNKEDCRLRLLQWRWKFEDEVENQC